MELPTYQLLPGTHYGTIDHRNDVVHQATLQVTNTRQLNLLRKQLSSAYKNQISIPPDELGHLFGLPLSLRLTHTASAVTAWLAIIEPANLAC